VNTLIHCLCIFMMNLFVLNSSILASDKGIDLINFFKESISDGNVMTPTCLEDRKSLIDYDKSFQFTDGYLLLSVPESVKKYVYCETYIGPFPIKPGCCFKLKIKSNNSYNNDKFTYLAFFCRNKVVKSTPQILYKSTIIGSGAFPLLTIDFATPVGIDSMILMIRIQNNNGLKPGLKNVYRELYIEKFGKLKCNNEAEKYIGKNLLPFTNFQYISTGPFRPGMNVFVTGPDRNTGKRCLNVDASIIEDNGSKILEIIKKEKAYIYPHFLSRSINLEGCLVEFSFNAKGDGIVSPGLWWKRRFLGHDYYHGPQVVLSNKWQRIKAIRACLDPLTEAATGSITVNSSQCRILIDNISMKIINQRKDKQ
jgi:hypothetical protein